MDTLYADFSTASAPAGMLMGFIIEDTGMWPKALGLERPIPDGGFNTFF